jgi:aminopeptidase
MRRFFSSSIKAASIIGVPSSAGKGPIFSKHETFLKAVGASGAAKEANLFISQDGSEAIAFVGVGPQDATEPTRKENIRQAAAKGYALLKGLKPEVIHVDSMGYPKEAAEGATLASYSFDLKTKGKANAEPAIEAAEMTKEWAEGVSAGRSQNFARRLADTPANLMTPSLFCEQVVDQIKSLGLSDKLQVSIVGEEQIQSMGMGCFWGVSKGSVEPPRLLTIQYSGDKKHASTVDLALVGKGVTFDTGGICLKPSKGMSAMKHDMAGAASVVSAVIGAAMTDAPINIIAVTPLCENMASGLALKPGDVVKSMSGLTVEVEDTDAEGRLILADALHYVQTAHNPKRIVDVATLTGAMCVAVGPFANGVYSSSEDLWGLVDQSAQRTGDRAWRMPLWSEYDELLRSPVADLKNIGSRDGGANSAARFLQRFVREGQSWAHIDMAAVMTASSYYGAKDRATGRPTRLLIDLAHSI